MPLQELLKRHARTGMPEYAATGAAQTARTYGNARKQIFEKKKSMNKKVVSSNPLT